MAYGKRRFFGSDSTDLVGEVPTQRLSVTETSVEEARVASNAVIFLGAAATQVPDMRIDVDRAVERLRIDGLTEAQLPSLAVVIHPESHYQGSDSSEGGGWFRRNEGVYVAGASDHDPDQWFPQAVHVIPGREGDVEDILWHELGHLVSAAQGKRERPPIGYRCMPLVRGLGFAGVVSSLGSAPFTLLNESMPVPVKLTALAIQAAGLGIGAVAAFAPDEVIGLANRWSAPERHAREFSRDHYTEQIVDFGGGPIPSNHFHVAEEHYFTAGVPRR